MDSKSLVAIVEQDGDLRRALQITIKEQGVFDIDFFENADEAVGAVSEDPYRFIAVNSSLRFDRNIKDRNIKDPNILKIIAESEADSIGHYLELSEYIVACARRQGSPNIDTPILVYGTSSDVEERYLSAGATAYAQLSGKGEVFREIERLLRE